MTNKERGRRGGNALASKYSSAYFSFIGRRGGRNLMAAQLRAAAAETPYPAMREHYLERAAEWSVDTGTKMMMSLWLKENCEPRPKRKTANGDTSKLRRWNRANKTA